MSPRRLPRPRAGATLQPLAERLLQKLRQVRKDPSDADAVHDARVAARRFLAAGELWASGEPGWPPLRARLNRWVRRLGRVRNLDVILPLVSRGDSERPARKALSRVLRKKRRKERVRLREWLTRRRLDRVERDLARLTRTVARRSIAPPGPGDLSPHFMKILALCALGPWSQDPASGHEVRREVRRLRYGCETLSWAYSAARYRQAMRVLLRVQDLAGAWHDRCVLQSLASRVMAEGRVSVPLVDLLARTQTEANELAAKFAVAVTELMDLRPVLVGDER